MRMRSLPYRRLLAAAIAAVASRVSCISTSCAMSSSSSQASAARSPHRFAVVGVGVLGTSLCRQILSEYAEDGVTGITKTTNNHENILHQVMGTTTSSSNDSGDRLRLVTNEELSSTPTKFQNVVFCAPPSGFDDYPAAVQQAIDTFWQGPEAGGVFVFTSSGAVYGPGNSGVVTETSPLADADSSPRVARLVQAEEVTLKAGGTCLRLAGLYSLERGPHNFWITKSLVESSPQGLINMLHYDDAASACLAALRAGPSVCQGRAFLISDGHAISRYDICASAIQASLYARYPMPTFTDATANQPPQQPWALGKVYDGSASNTALQWSPKYKSFDEFMKANS